MISMDPLRIADLDVSLGADLQPSVAEMGADVIMIENPRTGDRNRSLDETADGRALLICPVERRFWEGARPRGAGGAPRRTTGFSRVMRRESE